MKNRLERILSVICAAILMICALSACLAEEGLPATPTDLAPAQEEGTVPAAATEPAEEPQEKHVQEEPEKEDSGDSVEMIITKAISVNDSWKGQMRKTKPAVLKLDLAKKQNVHVVVLGRNVWVTVEKTDQISENAPRTETDPDTGRTIISWEAEAGSYLITLGPVEPSPAARAEVLVMDDDTFGNWEPEPETDPEEEPEAEPAGEPETDPEEEPETDPEEEPEAEPEPAEEPEAEPDPEEEPEAEPEPEEKPERHITVNTTWDVDNPRIGDTAHLEAKLTGYDGLQYTMQWQYSIDKMTWYDMPGETNIRMDVVATNENNFYWWRIVVFVEEDPEE